MPKFTPPFIYVDRDSFLEEEAKYQHELDQEDLEREWLRAWLGGPAAGEGDAVSACYKEIKKFARLL